MAVKFGKALGLKVVVLSTSPNKKTDAIDILKADKFVVTKDEEQFKVNRNRDGVSSFEKEKNLYGPIISNMVFFAVVVVINYLVSLSSLLIYVAKLNSPEFRCE